MRFLVFAVCLVMPLWVTATESLGERQRIVVAQSGKSSPRTLEDVQLVVDQHKGKFYALYAQALRKNPRLQGGVILSISIAPDGKVTKCAIASSTLHDPDMERGLVERFSAIRFGAKGNTVYNNAAFQLAEFFPA